MYSYVTEELPKVVFSNFDQIDSSRVSISGHSMGGHGALSLFLKNPGKYKSVSAFAPISNPLKAPWGEKAFKGYFGEKDWQPKGADHDATELIKKWKGGPLDILIDVVSESLLEPAQSLTYHRVRATTSTSSPNFYRRIWSRQRRKLDKRRESMSDFSLTMTIAILRWLRLRMIILIMLRNTSSHSAWVNKNTSRVLC